MKGVYIYIYIMMMGILIIIIMTIIDSVSSRHESVYKLSLLIPATSLCSYYSHFADLEGEAQRGSATCPFSHTEIADT